MGDIQFVVQEPWEFTLRGSKLGFWKKLNHLHDFKTLASDRKTLKAKIPGSAMRCTEISFSIKQCKCGKMIEEVRQEVGYVERE